MNNVLRVSVNKEKIKRAVALWRKLTPVPACKEFMGITWLT
jgi:hypothetical protein